MRSDDPPLALVLAGGRGRRLAPYTTVFPKPLAPIGDLPILEVILRQLDSFGVPEVVISLGHLGELIEAYVMTRERAGPKITYVREDEPLGTAGPVGLLDDVDRDVLVMNGDVLTNLDLRAVWTQHRRRGAELTVAVSAKSMSIDLGVVESDGDGTVTAYIEKPSMRYECAMGINVYAPSAVSAIPRGVARDFPALVRELLEAKRKVDVFRADCYWADIGRREDYEQAVENFDHLKDVLLPQG